MTSNLFDLTRVVRHIEYSMSAYNFGLDKTMFFGRNWIDYLLLFQIIMWVKDACNMWRSPEKDARDTKEQRRRLFDLPFPRTDETGDTGKPSCVYIAFGMKWHTWLFSFNKCITAIWNRNIYNRKHCSLKPTLPVAQAHNINNSYFLCPMNTKRERPTATVPQCEHRAAVHLGS